MFFLLLLLVLVILFYYVFIKPHQYFKNFKIHYIKPTLIVGNMGPFIFRQKSFADMIQNFYDSCDGRYIGIFSFLKPTLFIKDLDLLKQVCIKDFDHFVDHRTYISDEIDPLFGRSLFCLKGQAWREMRSTLSPAFTGKKIRAMFILIKDCAETFANHFTNIVISKEPVTIEMKNLSTRFATNVIASLAFGIHVDCLTDKDNEFYYMGKDIATFKGAKALKFFGYSISPSLMKLLKVKFFSDKLENFFRNIIKTNIKLRENEEITRYDMLHLLLQARKGKLKHEDNENDSAGFATAEETRYERQNMSLQEITDDVITAQALIFFFAGFDTISTAFSHAAYELAQHEEIQTKLQNEIDKSFEQCKGNISYETIIKLKYLDMVISESLRKWPPVPAMDRVCTKSYTIKPVNSGEVPVSLNVGDPIWFSFYSIHHDPKYYPNPEKFDPERFNDENKANILTGTYLPFGMGPRNCIGSRFALLEMKTALFYILKKFTFVLVEKSEIPIKINRDELNMNAQNGFWLGIQLRNI